MIKFSSALLFTLFFYINTMGAQNFSTHQVKKGETIDAIAQRYYVSVPDIYALNPDAKKELKPNTILIIPISKANKPKETETVELVGYKKHTVSRKETLYSLSKKYDVSEDDIKKHNKFLYANSLKKGDKIQIPVYKITKIKEAVAPTKPYIVKAKEGKWRIAYKFGISQEELERLNPNMGETLQEGQQIQVPNIDNSKEKQVDETYSYYKVLPKEGFYRLKVKLGLEQDTLEKLNPELKETGLKEGMILKIPFSNTASNITETSPISTPNKVNLSNKIASYETKHIAIMLPFRLNAVDFDSVPSTKQSIKKDAYLDASLDFYSGVLMALDSLKAHGISLKVDVYDTKLQVSEVSKILSENNFEDVDAVIGPLTTETFEKVASGLKAYNIPVISPIGTNLKLYDNVFQSRPSDDLLKTKIVNFVKADSLVKNIIIVSDTKNAAIANELKSEFNYAKMVFSRKNKEGKDQNYVMLNDLQSVLKPGKNIVFLETQSEGLVSNVVSNLSSLIRGDRDIILVTTNFNSAFEGDEVSNEQLSKLQLHFATISKGYNESNSFVKKYQKIYNITPDKRAVKGFDLTMDVVLRLVSSSDMYMSVNQSPLTEYVENKFAYKKKLFGGYYNDTVYLVKYDNLNIVEIK